MAKGASAVWEIRPTVGSDTNGGAYDSTISGAGTDYSQQTAAQVSVTDAVTNGTTTVTSATASFTSAMVGNACYMSGAGVTTDRYFVTGFTNSTTITVDRSPGTGSGGTLKLGGALATQAEAYSTRGGIGSNVFWVKATGTDSLTATLTPPGGAATAFTRIFGYTTTRGDNGQATVQVSSGTFFMYTLSGGDITLQNFILDGNLLATRCASVTASGTSLRNVYVKNFTDYGIFAGGSGWHVSCRATGGKTGATAGLAAGAAGSVFINCESSANNCAGLESEASSTSFLRCLSWGNLGANGVGYKAFSGGKVLLLSCTFQGNASDGVLAASSAINDYLSIRNCIFSGNGGIGINVPGSPVSPDADYNAFFSNTGGNRAAGFPAGAHDVTLTGDPFVNAAGGNFALNNTAGAGAACRAAGYPGAFPGGTTTGYLDIGAVQHQDSGGAAGMLYIPDMAGGCN